jgi:hypothetical protein
MENTLVIVVKSHLRAHPPENVFDVIRAAEFIIRDTGARVTLETLLTKLKDEIEDDLGLKLAYLINTGLVRELVGELRPKKQPRCCF